MIYYRIIGWSIDHFIVLSTFETEDLAVIKCHELLDAGCYTFVEKVDISSGCRVFTRIQD